MLRERVPMSASSKGKRASRIGFWVFFFGLVLIVATFGLTLWAFLAVDAALRGAARSFSASAAAGMSPVSVFFAGVGARLGALLVMGICGSLVASQGLRLWFAGRAVEGSVASKSPEPAEEEAPSAEESGA